MGGGERQGGPKAKQKAENNIGINTALDDSIKIGETRYLDGKYSVKVLEKVEDINQPLYRVKALMDLKLGGLQEKEGLEFHALAITLHKKLSCPTCGKKVEETDAYYCPRCQRYADSNVELEFEGNHPVVTIEGKKTVLPLFLDEYTIQSLKRPEIAEKLRTLVKEKKGKQPSSIISEWIKNNYPIVKTPAPEYFCGLESCGHAKLEPVDQAGEKKYSCPKHGVQGAYLTKKGYDRLKAQGKI